MIIQFIGDGVGINPDFIAQKAVQKGITTKDEIKEMSVKDKLNLVFTAGFSTAQQVTSVSGRGIGMDVVKPILSKSAARLILILNWANGQVSP